MVKSFITVFIIMKGWKRSKHKPFWIELSRGWVTTMTRQVVRRHLNEMLILIRSDLFIFAKKMAFATGSVVAT